MIRSSVATVLGRTTGSDEPTTEQGIDASGGDNADATTDVGPELPEGAEPDLRDVGLRSSEPTSSRQASASALLRLGLLGLPRHEAGVGDVAEELAGRRPAPRFRFECLGQHGADPFGSDGHPRRGR